jgi:hypothetical protein
MEYDENYNKAILQGFSSVLMPIVCNTVHYFSLA